MALLLKLAGAFSNFESVVRTEVGAWDPALPMCDSWQGITCWPDGSVQTVSFHIPALAPPMPVPSADTNSSAHASVNHQLRGYFPRHISQSACDSHHSMPFHSMRACSTVCCSLGCFSFSCHVRSMVSDVLGSVETSVMQPISVASYCSHSVLRLPFSLFPSVNHAKLI